ncbi:elongation factor Tu domain 2 family protein, partial [Vibrio harveyi]
TSRNGSS